MSSTPRSTRSRTRALRKSSGDKQPKLDSPPSDHQSQTEDNTSENDNSWVDVSDTAEEGDSSAKSAQSNVLTAPATRRTPGTKARRRKRVGGIQTPTRKQTPVFAAVNYPNPNTPTRQARGKTPPQEVLQQEALCEVKPNNDIPVLPEKRKEVLYQGIPHLPRERTPALRSVEDRPSHQEPPEFMKERTPSRETPKPVGSHENGLKGHTHTTPTKISNSLPKISAEELVDGAVKGVSFGSWYIFDVVRTALALLRKPLGLVLFLWMLAMILSAVSQTLRTAFAPLCWLPVVSSSVMCRPMPLPPQGVNYPRLMETQTKTFEQLLDESSGGSALSLEVKKAEMATSDLATVVRISTMRSKDALADMLSDFVQDAKKTARRLHRLHSKVGGSVDSIMAVNDHALRTIEATNSKDTLLSFDTLIPWRQSRKSKVVMSTFQDAMDTLSAQISRLVLEAEVNIENLNELEERLNGIHELVAREDKSVKADRDELLARLWTALGGNKKELKNFNENLVTLTDIGKYRRQARMHVIATLQTLQSLSEDMEELRERVATPGLVGESIPLEVQMKSIQYGLDRLKENRIRARRTHEAAVHYRAGVGRN